MPLTPDAPRRGGLKSRIQNLSQAEEYARAYADAVSQAEQIEEALKEYAEAHPDLIGRERALGPALVGFERIAPSVAVPAKQIEWLANFFPRFVSQKPVVDKPGLRAFLRQKKGQLADKFARHGIVPVAGYRRFYLRLARARRNGDGS